MFRVGLSEGRDRCCLSILFEVIISIAAPCIFHTRAHTLQTDSMYLTLEINISMLMCEGGVVYLTQHFMSGSGIPIVAIAQLVDAFV